MKFPIAVSVVLTCLLQCPASAQGTSSGSTPEADNEEVSRLYAEDQSDRQPRDHKAIDWDLVGPRDDVRIKRIQELYTNGKLSTGADYFHAALILQHGTSPEDFLLCHELCISAVFKAERPEKAQWVSSARWLAAASEDRFLLSIGRAQRFGTQYTRGEDSVVRLDKLEDGVSDELRKVWDVPTIAKAREREAQMHRK